MLFPFYFRVFLPRDQAGYIYIQRLSVHFRSNLPPSLSLHPFLTFLSQPSLSTGKNARLDNEGTMKSSLITTILLPLVLSAPFPAPRDDHSQADIRAAHLHAYAEARGVSDSTSVISLNDAYVAITPCLFFCLHHQQIKNES